MTAAVKLTPWFPAAIKPVRTGLYECERLERGRARVVRKLEWDGTSWRYHDAIGSLVEPGQRAAMSGADGDKWRGLAADPSKVKP